MSVFGFLLLCKEEGSSPLSLQLLRGGIWACMRSPCRVFYGFWDRDYVSQLTCVRYYVLKAVLKILVRNASPRRPMWFRCLIFNL